MIRFRTTALLGAFLSVLAAAAPVAQDSSRDSLSLRPPVAAPLAVSDPALDSLTLRLPHSFPSDSETALRGSPHPALAAGASLVLPGLGQILCGHPVKGGVAMALDLTLYGIGYSQFVNVSDLRNRQAASNAVEADLRRQLATLPSPADTIAFKAAKGDSLTSLRNGAADNAYQNRERVQTSLDNRNLLLTWAVGVHAWAVVDAFDAAYHDRHPIQGGRDAVTAGLWAAFLPGAGQIYNERYGKAAMLWMAVAGCVSSVRSHQSTLEFYQDEYRLAVSDGRTAYQSQIASQEDLYRKRRNQYYWGLGVLYIYQIIDAVVDARLDELKKPFRLTLEPHPGGPGLLASLSF
jgi:TM2 domain-containing membrane protein YozV